MENIRTRGLVVAEREYGDNDKLLTLLCPEGKRFTTGKGVKSFKSRHFSSCRLFAYSDFVLRRKGDGCYIVETELIEDFFTLGSDIADYALASYICSFTDSVTVENEDALAMLRLTLNALYAVSKKLAPRDFIKAAFELRAASESGFMPDLSACADCGCENPQPVYLQVMEGAIICGGCKDEREARDEHPELGIDRFGELKMYLPLSVSVLETMRNIVGAMIEKFLSVRPADADIPELSRICETYALSHIGHGFDTLTYYKKVSGIKA
jgi:DNA repair protein RecO (recombination protein O)